VSLQPVQSSEVRAIIHAMQRENERVQSARTQSTMSDEKPYFDSVTPVGLPQRGIAFI